MGSERSGARPTRGPGLVEQPNLIASADVPELSVRFWLLVIAVGVLTGLAGAALMALLNAAAYLTYSVSSAQAGGFLAAVERTDAAHRVVALAAAGAVAGAGWWLLDRLTGPGGSEVSTALWRHEGRLPLRRSLGTAVLSEVIVGMGASLGREAAPRLTGAALAARLCDWAGLSGAHRKLLAAFGAGAGMACVYNVPFGATLLTLEVMLGALSLRLAVPALACSCIATAVGWIALPTRPTYRLPAVPLSASLIFFGLLIGPIAALVAVGWVRMIRLAHLHRPRGRWRPAVPLLVFTAVGVLAIPYPQLLGNGKDIVQLTFGTGLAVPTIAALLVLKPLATAGSLGSGASGGLFTPTVAAGSLLGVLAGQGWTRMWPGTAAGFAAIGAAAVLAAAMQAPVAAVVLMLELTWHLDALVVPMLLAVVGATVVSGRLRTPSIYSVRLPAQ